jgi:hypothetical protein
MKSVLFFSLVGLLFIPGITQPDSSRLLLPSDLNYLGAFRINPESDGNTSWNAGGGGMTFYPGGDPNGPNDGYPGSLFGIGHTVRGGVSEFDIPETVISPTKDLNELNMAKTIQGFYDITEGRHEGGAGGYSLTGIEYLPAQGQMTEDKIHWCMHIYYMPPRDTFSHSWASLDLSNPNTPGFWSLGDAGEFHSGTVSHYIFEIPKTWADVHTPGKYLATGRFRSQAGSFGPTLYAYGPWNHGNPPADGAALDAVEMLRYPSAGEMFGVMSDDTTFGFHNADDWADGAWLTSGGKQAVIITGTKALGSICYGTPDKTLECDLYCGGKGYQADDYGACILFYDPADLEAVLDSQMNMNEPQPYSYIVMDSLMFMSGCTRRTLEGTGYDRANNLLYITEAGADTLPGDYDSRPIVHTWRVGSQSSVAAPGSNATVRDLSVEVWPNPFSTNVFFEMRNTNSELHNMDIGIYDIAGKQVCQLYHRGSHSAVRGSGYAWHAQDQPNGVYFVKIKTGQVELSKKIILFR